MDDERYWRHFKVLNIKVHTWLHIMDTHRASVMHTLRAIYMLQTTDCILTITFNKCRNASLAMSASLALCYAALTKEEQL